MSPVDRPSVDGEQALAAASAHHQAGDLDAAEAAYRGALAAGATLADARRAEAHHGLGVLLRQRGRAAEAIEQLRAAAALAPDDAPTQHNLGAALGEAGALGEAVAHYERALAIAPNYALAWKNLAVALQRQARLDDAIEASRRAIALDPSLRGVHSNLLFLLTHSSDHDPAAVFTEHRRWAIQHADHLAPARWADDGRDRDPTRRLHVGYVSPDFREHAVAFFIEPLLRAHDRDAVAVFCYANVEHADATTERLRGLADGWRAVWDEPDEAVAARIREDGIDLLVDLAGHTRDNRLLAFAGRPAPVQLSYLGYANTTGLEAIDYRLTDGIADPEGTGAERHSEPLIRLPRSFLCYRPPDAAPEVAPARPSKDGAVTFGSFNKALKISPRVVALWARLLAALPRSSLLLKSDSFADSTAREGLLAAFEAQDVDRARISLLPAEETIAAHLRRYSEIDLALDPFPYNGATTTCEALWMGVPVVALAGTAHAGRVSASILAAVGLPELVAASEDAYIEIALALASDDERRAQLRSSLRKRMLASPLCDAEGAAQALEEAYRTLWQRFVEGAPIDLASRRLESVS